VSEAIRELVDAYNDAWNGQDLDGLAACHADDIVFENHTVGGRVERAQAVRAHIGGIFERWPSLRFQGRPVLRGRRFRGQQIDGDRDQG
jgi:ketosteroid isomerase-like protein